MKLQKEVEKLHEKNSIFIDVIGCFVLIDFLHLRCFFRNFSSGIGSEAATTPDSGSSEQPTMPNETAYDGVFPQHEPYGTGQG